MDQQYDPRPEQPTPTIQGDTPLTATLTAAEWNVVQAGLHELPMKYVAALTAKIKRQVFADAYGNREQEP